MGKLFFIIYFFWVAVFTLVWHEVKQLPEPAAIDQALLNEPVQAKGTLRPDFSFPYRGKTYQVKPQAEYELWGLVVSKNDIGAWFNYYHDENSVNLKDLCVVWGENISSGAYRQDNLKFNSGEWTCYYRWFGRLKTTFNSDELSNNHLLSDSESVRQAIKRANLGDQIHFKGVLADYAEQGTGWYRLTSLSRQDANSNARGGGACEIVFVDQFDIIKAHRPYLNYLYDWRWKILLMIIAINLLSFFYQIHRSVPRPPREFTSKK